MDAYEKIYADSRKWLVNGWVDYLAPQLYWPIASREQSFPALFNWWESQNPDYRHVWPALADSSVGTKFSAAEIPHQIQIIRQRDDPGEVHYHLRSILENPALAAAVQSQYAQPALVPVSPWIAAPPLLKPRLTVDSGESSAHVRWENSNIEPPRWWLLQSRANGIWTTQIFPAEPNRIVILDNGIPDAICLRAVDRLGNLSEPAVWTSTDEGETGIRQPLFTSSLASVRVQR